MRGLVLALAFVAAGPAFAVQPDEILADPALEARARDISALIRCPVCQGETIDDSNAPIAHDLRLMVRERLTAGDSDSAVIDYLVARYGEFILFQPRARGSNLILWLILIFGSTPLVHFRYEHMLRTKKWNTTIINSVVYAALFIVCIAYLVTETYNPFLYFRF